MSTTAPFASLALYPGGQGLCGISSTNPYPSGVPFPITSVSFNSSEAPAVLGLVWNMQDWAVSFTAECDISFSVPGTPPTTISAVGEYECSGRFYQGFLSEFASTNLAPSRRICGSLNSSVNGDFISPTILPDVFLESPNTPPTTFSTSTTHGNISNTYTVTALSLTGGNESSIGFGVTFEKIWVKADNSIEVFFTPSFRVLPNVAPENDPIISASLDPTGSPRTITVLGKTATINVKASAIDGFFDSNNNYISTSTPATINTFSLSYSVSVLSSWDYA